jgi:hypothetical protein
VITYEAKQSLIFSKLVQLCAAAGCSAENLERRMAVLQAELNNLKENPGTRIDRIEYKFDS